MGSSYWIRENKGPAPNKDQIVIYQIFPDQGRYLAACSEPGQSFKDTTSTMRPEF